MGAVGVRPANERDDQQALPSKAEGHGGKQRSKGTIRVNIREPGFWESRLPQLQHRDQHREAEQTSDKCYIGLPQWFETVIHLSQTLQAIQAPSVRIVRATG